jgi:hypothetical protein
VPNFVRSGGSGRKLQTTSPYLTRRKDGLYLYRVELAPFMFSASGRILPVATSAVRTPVRLSLAIRLRKPRAGEAQALPAGADGGAASSNPRLLGSAPYALQFGGSARVLTSDRGIRFVAGPRLHTRERTKMKLARPSEFVYHMAVAGRVSVGECTQRSGRLSWVAWAGSRGAT